MMPASELLGAAVAAAILVYLLIALFLPEKF